MKKTRLRYALSAVMLMAFAVSSAESLTSQQALERFVAEGNSPVKKSPALKGALKLRYTGYTPAKTAATYIFTDAADAFYILPANDQLPALLGYGDNINLDNMPPAMQWWLELVAQTETLAATDDHDAISPLVKTEWGQSAPFYNLCPLDNGKRSVTGCVATSVSQVVNYHRLPSGKGFGTHSYSWNNQTLSFDYSSTQFDWENMLDKYYGATYTDSQATAVATLMYATGVGLNMDYSSSESGAVDSRISSLLYEHYGFDKGVALMLRNYFSASDWDNIIYSELEAGRPVVYGGITPSGGGHSFVCDGYQGSGYYHINWGWDGTSNGYFLLANLNPSDQGTGSYEGGYNLRQTAVIGIQPPVEGSEIFLPLYANGGFAYSEDYNAFWFGEGYGFFNYSAASMEFYPGLQLIGKARQNYYVSSDLATLSGCNDSGQISGRAYFRVTLPEDLEPGTYEAYPVAKLAGSDTWQKIYVPADDTQYVTIRKGSNGVVTYDGSDPDDITISVTVSSIAQTDEWTTGENGVMAVALDNTGSSASDLALMFKFTNDATSQTYDVGVWSLSVPAGKVNANLQFTVELPAGKYSVYAVDYTYKNKISDYYTVYVGVQPTSVSVTPSSVVLKEGESYQLSAEVLPADAFDTKVTWTSDAPDVATVDINGNVTALARGTAVITATTANGLTSTSEVTVTIPTGVDAIPDITSATPRYFNLQGVEIAAPEKGNIYIVVRNGKAVKEIF